MAGASHSPEDTSRAYESAHMGMLNRAHDRCVRPVWALAPSPTTRGRRTFVIFKARSRHHLRRRIGARPRSVIRSALYLGERASRQSIVQKSLERPQPGVHYLFVDWAKALDTDKGKPPVRGGRKATGLEELAGPPKSSEHSALRLAVRPSRVEGGRCAARGKRGEHCRSSQVWEQRS